ncbi:MAG: GGDEF domain-containing protein [Armatimonadota bacterium]|nr:GGDEF domain-containing protein [Armatimonadota bacterium]
MIGAVEVFSDNSATRAMMEQVKWLESLAYVDPLTALPNRRYAQTALHNRLEEMRRYGWVVGLLVADVDHFKRVNDRWGHPAGDQVLQMVARTLSHSARAFDVVARWGGEEFVIVLPHVDAPGLKSAASRFRALVERSDLRYGDQILRVTISLGGTLAVATDTVETLFARADEALFRAKEEGRNRVCLNLPDGFVLLASEPTP